MAAMHVRKPSQQEIARAEKWGIWTKEPSEFPWFYDEKETCYILEGEAEISDEQGNMISIKKGDWVEFEQGLEATWKILKGIKKRYMFGE